MKKALIAVTLVLSLCGIGFAQSERTSVGDSITATVERNSQNALYDYLPAVSHVVNEGVQVGPNTVTVRKIVHGKVVSEYTSHNLKTTFGVDIILGCLGGATCPSNAGLAPFTWLNLSTNGGSPAAGDCVSPGGSSNCPFASLLTASGLAPAQAVFAHTAGTNTSTLTYTWTSTATIANIQKAAISPFSLATCTGFQCYYVFENTFAPVSLNPADQLQIVWTITAT